MSTDTTDQPVAGIGHNISPVVLPKEPEMLADLQRRYPEIDRELGEFEKSFATYDDAKGKPLELGLQQADIAKALSDLIDDAKKSRRTWKAHGTGEKGPLNKLVKVVTNFFSAADEKITAFLDRHEPQLEEYIQKVNAEKERKRQEEIARQEAKAEEARKAALAAAAAAAKAEADAAAQRERERLAREAAEKAERDQREAEERAALALAEEKRLAAEKATRDRAEKERNAAGIRDAKAMLKIAERLHQLAEAEESTDGEQVTLEAHIKPGGSISAVMTPVAASTLLTEEQVADIQALKDRLTALRTAGDARLTKRQAAARKKATEAEESRQAELTARRKAEQEKADAELEATRAARKAEQDAADKAKLERTTAVGEARNAREEARQHEQGARGAGREAARAGTDAQRAENRADRLEGQGEARASVKGELGSNSGLTRRWAHYVDDEAAIRATMGPLGPFLGLDAIKASAFHWMRAHQEGFQGERVEPAELPGVRFAVEEDLTSR